MIGQPTTTIKNVVRRYYGLQRGVLEGRCTCNPHMRARSVAIFLACELTDCSAGKIGRIIGNRSKGNVKETCRAAEKRIAADPDFTFEVDQVRRLCRAQFAGGQKQGPARPPLHQTSKGY